MVKQELSERLGRQSVLLARWRQAAESAQQAKGLDVANEVPPNHEYSCSVLCFVAAVGPGFLRWKFQ